jgi:hypothetical protein
VLLLEKVDAMTLAAMQAGDEGADFNVSRQRLHDLLNEPMVRPALYTTEERELRMAVGLSA